MSHSSKLRLFVVLELIILVSLSFSQEIDELVEDWTPEPLVADVSEADERDNNSRPVIVGYYTFFSLFDLLNSSSLIRL